MARPVEHGIGSAATVSAWETVKGAATGAVTSFLIGALIVGGLAAGGGAIVGALLPHITALGTAMVVGSIGALVGGTGSAISLGGISTLVGGIIGLARGGSRVSNENQAYKARVEAQNQTKEITRMQELNNAVTMGVKQGYGLAAADIQNSMAASALAPVANEAPQKSFAAGLKPKENHQQVVVDGKAAAEQSAGRGA